VPVGVGQAQSHGHVGGMGPSGAAHAEEVASFLLGEAYQASVHQIVIATSWSMLASLLLGGDLTTVW
jgi:hypothetical protein